MDEREITIVKGGRETPFSRGILAHTLAQAGARAELAHQIASEVRAELLAEQVYTVEEEEVLARVRDKLVKKDAFVVGRLDKWRVLRESTEPIVVLIGGATGVGTSTLAADVARRLNIQSVVGTDSIREVLRRAISPDLLPLLHKSSYEIKREDVRVPVEEELLWSRGRRSGLIARRRTSLMESVPTTLWMLRRLATSAASVLVPTPVAPPIRTTMGSVDSRRTRHLSSLPTTKASFLTNLSLTRARTSSSSTV